MCLPLRNYCKHELLSVLLFNFNEAPCFCLYGWCAFTNWVFSWNVFPWYFLNDYYAFLVIHFCVAVLDLGVWFTMWESVRELLRIAWRNQRSWLLLILSLIVMLVYALLLCLIFTHTHSAITTMIHFLMTVHHSLLYKLLPWRL